MAKNILHLLAPGVECLREIYFEKMSQVSMLNQLQLIIVRTSSFDMEDYKDLSDSFYYSYEKIWESQMPEMNVVAQPTATSNYSRVTLISDDNIEFNSTRWSIISAKKPSEIIMFIGGGGFIASTDKLQEMFLRDYCKKLGMTAFELHYKLAPNFKYPYQIHEVFESYLNIVYYYKYVLNIPLTKIVLMGDSAGGNLAMGLTNLLILFRQRLPDGLILVYPATNLNEKRYTPSLINAFSERLLYFTILEKCLTHYIDAAYDASKDWLLSPGMTPDYILRQYPKTDIIVGEFDPLLDDCYRLGYRLNNIGMDTRLFLYESLFHGFLTFQMPFGQGISEVSKIHDQIKKLIVEI